jgi:hypothetical protein
MVYTTSHSIKILQNETDATAPRKVRNASSVSSLSTEQERAFIAQRLVEVDEHGRGRITEIGLDELTLWGF